MADVKISGLPASTTPLAGTEVLPIVQGGQTRQVSVANLTAARAVSALSITSTDDGSINGLTVGRGPGSVSTNTVLGSGALAANVTGTTSVAIGRQALNKSTSSANTAIGAEALFTNLTGSNNVAAGYRAVYSNSNGATLTGIGNYALFNNTSGSNSVALGYYAGFSNTTNGSSCYVGVLAGQHNTGAQNTILGYAALNGVSGSSTGGSNVAIGWNTLAQATTADSSTSVGYQSLFATTTGGGNIAIGFRAGFGNSSPNANTTGISNTYIGNNTVGSAATNTNEIVIGNSAVGNGSNTTTIGNSSTTNTVIPAGNATLTNGNLVMGTAAKGIDFSINPNPAGATSELLNDYEEGTWTPVLAGDGTAGTYELVNVLGTYTKIGRQVTVQCVLSTAGSVTGGGAGNLILTGLPFAKAASNNAYAAAATGGLAYTAGGTFFVTFGTTGSTSTAYFALSTSGGAFTFQSVSLLGTSKFLGFTLTYFTA